MLSTAAHRTMPGAIATRCAKTEVSSKTLGLPDTTEHELIQALEDQGWKWERLPAKRRVSDEMVVFSYEIGSAKTWKTRAPRTVPAAVYAKLLNGVPQPGAPAHFAAGG